MCMCTEDERLPTDEEVERRMAPVMERTIEEAKQLCKFYDDWDRETEQEDLQREAWMAQRGKVRDNLQHPGWYS